ncbi:hypothetical protein DSCA_16460 [Desulfosarcina alkanivorans]|uniref:Uncharacterized protein n=1 Tax=Desulfosarcina alkanivorans TaxID=571177 RepID=A0A5K7YFA7_9BACT|nr:hypothetical protein [Desulfosarcina alkanivorans]BBO67716.1 hypothetical protein DSCA_16460 [Desulfosarcina alkanivorans]
MIAEVALKNSDSIIYFFENGEKILRILIKSFETISKECPSSLGDFQYALNKITEMVTVKIVKGIDSTTKPVSIFTPP